MRIMIVGAGGLLGQSCARAFAARDEVIPLTHGQLDACDAAAVYEVVAQKQPDWVVNAAAMTDVDACEKHPARAFAVNTGLPASLALCCERHGVRLMHISTDYVFDGEKGAPYHEWDKPNPINEYGRSKYWGEVAALEAKRAVVVRTQWLYGNERPGFIGRVLEAARRGETVHAVADREGSPTYAPDLAQLLSKLVHLSAYGIFHAANQGAASWYTLACDALRMAGLTAEVKAVDSAHYPEAAKRPRCSVLQGLRLGGCGIAPLRPYKEALAEFLRGYMQDSALKALSESADV